VHMLSGSHSQLQFQLVMLSVGNHDIDAHFALWRVPSEIVFKQIWTCKWLLYHTCFVFCVEFMARIREKQAS
jgi:hypothetical protein